MLSDVTVLAAALSRPDYAHCALCCARLGGGNFLPWTCAGTGRLARYSTHSLLGGDGSGHHHHHHTVQSALMYCNNVLHEHNDGEAETQVGSSFFSIEWLSPD